VTSAWWAGLPPIEEWISGAADNHRIRWSDGELSLLDHDDPDGEFLLAALGGEQCPCLRILDAWQRHRVDLYVLLLGSRGAADPLDMVRMTGGQTHGPRPTSAPPGGPSGPRPGPRFTAAVGPRPRGAAGAAHAGRPLRHRGGGSSGQRFGYTPIPRQDALAMLLSLPGGLPIRLVATVIAVWAERIADGDAQVAAVRPALQAALYGRAVAALRAWLGSDLSIDVRLADVPAASRGRGGDNVVVELPFSWLRDVWVRGFAVLAGRFCLTARQNGPDDWTFTAVDPDFGEPARFRLRTW
jgi:hypothetical protein